MTDSNGHELDPRAATSKPDTTRQRGLIIISALINFIDWLDAEDVVNLPEKERAELVMQFLRAHADGKNYYMQAEQIAAILGEALDSGVAR